MIRRFAKSKTVNFHQRRDVEGWILWKGKETGRILSTLVGSVGRPDRNLPEQVTPRVNSTRVTTSVCTYYCVPSVSSFGTLLSYKTSCSKGPYDCHSSTGLWDKGRRSGLPTVPTGNGQQILIVVPTWNIVYLGTYKNQNTSVNGTFIGCRHVRCQLTYN